MLRTFYKLKQAKEYAERKCVGVWAEDLANGKKKFLVAPFAAILNHCNLISKPSLYELIHEGVHARLYFDIEIHQYQQNDLNDMVILNNLQLLQLDESLKEQYCNNAQLEIREDFCSFFKKFFIKALRKYVERTLEISVEEGDITVLSACRASKLSFHIVCPTLIFDRHNTSMAFYVEDFAHCFLNNLKEDFFNPSTDIVQKGYLLRAMCLNQGKAFAIDLAPYGKTQQFRMFGCGKIGKAPLRLITTDNTPLLPPEDFHWNFSEMWGSMTQFDKNTVFAQYRVQLDVEQTPIHITPGNSTRNSARRYYNQYNQGQSLVCHFKGERCEPLYPKKRNIIRQGVIRRISSEDNNRGYNTDLREVPNYETIFNEYGRKVRIDDLEDGDSVFCEKCEFLDNVPFGDSSAKIMKRNDTWMVYCFNCQESILKIIQTFEFLPIVVDDRTERITLHDRYLNQGIQDVSLNDNYRLFAIDAPTGSGKSYMLRQWIKDDEMFFSKIVFIYSKQGLCRAMASYFEIPCYLDFEYQDWQHPPDKFVICLNSVIKLPRPFQTDAIVLDEGGLTRKDTSAATIIPKLSEVLRTMHNLCADTKKVILTQHNLSQSDLEYYSNFIPNLIDDQIFKRIFSQTRAKHSDIEYSESFQVILKKTKDLYLESAGNGKAILIVGSSASMIRTLTLQIKHWAAEHEFDQGRIRGLWGANQHEEWNQFFLTNPNADHQVDAVLFTHFIQAGLSIENDLFDKKIMLFPNSYIDHGLEYQLSNRLRVPVPAYAFIETGRKDNAEKNVKALTARYQHINNYCWPSYQLETFAEVECEHRDTIHFHVEKWERRSRLQGTFKFKNMPENDELVKVAEGNLFSEHVDCAQGIQKRIYNNLLFRSQSVSVEAFNAQDEIGRILHWDVQKSEKIIKELTKHSLDSGIFIVILETDFKFIMAVSNEKENAYITEPNLIRLVALPHKLCHTLDYLLSTVRSDAEDYWGQHLALAKRIQRVAHTLLIPGIVKILPEMGIEIPDSLFHFKEEKILLEVEICQRTLVEAYLLQDPGFKYYNVVYDSERVSYNRQMKQYQCRNIKFSTPNLVKRFLKHLGLDLVTCRLVKKNGNKPKYEESAKYRIGIPPITRSFSILSCVYDSNHWGNFQILSDAIKYFIEKDIYSYKENIIEEHYDKEGEGELIGSQDTLMGDLPSVSRDSSLGAFWLILGLSFTEIVSGLDTFMEE